MSRRTGRSKAEVVYRDRAKATCGICGRTVMRDNLRKHEGSPVCVVTRAEQDLAAADLAFVPKTWHAKLRAIDVTLERAPHRYDWSKDTLWNGEKGALGAVIDGMYAPSWVAILVSLTNFPVAQRVELIEHGLDRPEFQLTVKRLYRMDCPCVGGPGPNRMAHDMLYHYLLDVTLKEIS